MGGDGGPGPESFTNGALAALSRLDRVTPVNAVSLSAWCDRSSLCSLGLPPSDPDREACLSGGCGKLPGVALAGGVGGFGKIPGLASAAVAAAGGGFAGLGKALGAGGGLSLSKSSKSKSSSPS